jgi:hypothetical protein
MNTSPRLTLLVVIAQSVGTTAAVGVAGWRMVDNRRSAVPTVSEVRPSEVRPSEVRPSEVRPSEVRPSEVRPSEVRPSEVRPSEVRPSEARPSESLPVPRVPTVCGVGPAEAAEADSRPPSLGPTRSGGKAPANDAEHWDDGEPPDPGPPPPASRRHRTDPSRSGAPRSQRAPIVVPRSVKDWGI